MVQFPLKSRENNSVLTGFNKKWSVLYQRNRFASIARTLVVQFTLKSRENDNMLTGFHKKPSKSLVLYTTGVRSAMSIIEGYWFLILAVYF